MAITPNANLSTTYNEIIVEGTTELLKGRTAIGTYVANSVQDMAGRHGNTIRYHRHPKGTVRNASDGSAKNYTTPVGSTDELVLEYYKEIPLEAGDLDFTIADPEMAISMAGKENMRRYQEAAAKGLATQIDIDGLEALLDDPYIGEATVIGNPNTTLNDKTFTDIRKTLVKQGVDISDVVIMLNPDHSAEVMGIDTFRNADYIGEGDARRVQINGQLPLNIYGMAVYMDIVNLPNTNSIASISGSSTSDFVSVAMSRQAFKFVMPEIKTPAGAERNTAFATSNVDGLSLRVRTWYQPEINTSRLVVDALYGFKTLKTASLQSATDVVSVVPVLGGIPS
jgi:ribosomal protein L25 (general stress protein Ctc)